jgi:methanol---5-hydroxybenzimidazolylcobamide Co-methyltransferase
MAKYTSMAYGSADEMIFGTAKKPVSIGIGPVELGSKYVYPQIVPHPRPGSEASKEKILREYQRMTDDALGRCVALGFPGLVIEFEHIYQMTSQPEWAAAIHAQSKAQMQDYHDKYGLKSALISTVADLRKPDMVHMRKSQELDWMLGSFQSTAANGADVLSIETMGGKEVFDYAVQRQDIKGVIFGIGVLSSLDMAWLWPQIVDIAKKNNINPGGDTDCARGNTAMFLAGGYVSTDLPHTFAALARACSAARSLVAYESGATGPTKDCAYEDPIVKAITGVPITMEGVASACAHSEMQSNIVSAVVDLWSNEAVEYHDMFGGSSVEVFTEILGYNVAQMNAAIELGSAKELQAINIASDKYRDVHGFMLSPDNAYEIGKAIVSNVDSYYLRSKTAVLRTADLISGDSKLQLTDFEREALDKARREVEALPDNEGDFIDQCLAEYKKVPGFDPTSYGL